MRNATNTTLLWDVKSGDVLLKPWPETDGEHLNYKSGLACYLPIQKATFEQRKLMVFIEAMHLVVRDGIDPQKLHKVMMELEEYRDGCAYDMPGMSRK